MDPIHDSLGCTPPNQKTIQANAHANNTHAMLSICALIVIFTNQLLLINWLIGGD